MIRVDMVEKRGDIEAGLKIVVSEEFPAVVIDKQSKIASTG